MPMLTCCATVIRILAHIRSNSAAFMYSTDTNKKSYSDSTAAASKKQLQLYAQDALVGSHACD